MRQKLTRLCRTSGKSFINALLDTLFPPRCHCCRAFIPDAGRIHICSRCLGDMKLLSSPLCPICGIPFATPGGIDHACSSCISDPPPFTAARAAMVHDGPARDLVHRFKYDGKVQLRRPLGLLFAERLAPFIAASAPDVVIPVPLHLNRLRQRGFNQAVLLGEVVAKEWGLPLDRTGLCRTRMTEPQTEFSALERRRNVRGAFGFGNGAAVVGRKVLLVDDVYTTGSTAGECARTLRRGGAAEVFVATVVRAVRY